MKKLNYPLLLIVLSSALGLIVLAYLGFWSYLAKVISDNCYRIEFMQLAITIIIAVPSVVLFYLSYIKKNNDFLTLKLDVKEGKNCKIIESTITNPVNTFKHVEFACLVVSKHPDKSDEKKAEQSSKKEPCNDKQASPNDSTILESDRDYHFFTRLTNLTNQRNSINSTDEIIRLKDNGTVVSRCKDFAFIPLPFFYEENIRYGNEIVGYSYPFNSNLLDAGVYDVRLFVFRSDKGYHRTTHTIMEI